MFGTFYNGYIQLLRECQNLARRVSYLLKLWTSIQETQDTHIADSTIHFTVGSISHTAIQDIGTNSHANIDLHISSTSNPHSVTAGQVGAYTSGQVDTLLTGYEPVDATILRDADIGVSVQAYNANTVVDADYASDKSRLANTSGTNTGDQDLSPYASHITNTANPHSVTAGQVGAYTSGQVDTLLASKEPTISLGTTAQYWRGDKSWQPLNTDAIAQANKIGNPIHIDTLQEQINHLWSSGIVHGCELTDNGNGTISIASGYAMLRATTSSHATIYSVEVPAQASISLTDNATNFVYLSYNSGSPQFFASTTSTDVNMLTTVPAYVVVRIGTSLTYIDVREQNVDFIAKTQIKTYYTQSFVRKDGGCVVSDAGTRHLQCSSGAFYFQTTEYAVPALDTTGTDTFTYYYRDGSGGWTSSSSAIISNLNYDDGTGTLATLDNNKFGVHWIYAVVGSTSSYAVVYGQQQYAKLEDAQVAQIPATLPAIINGLGVLVGRAIIQKSATELSEVASAFTTVFAPGTASSSGHVIQNEGTPLTARANLNFIGASVTASDNAGTNSTDVTITASASQPLTGYTLTNVTLDKSLDANSTTLDEVADVLGTLIDDLQNGYAGSSRESFETVSANLKAWDKTFNRTGDVLTSIDYTSGALTITKTFNRTGDVLTSLVLSGDVPSGMSLTKTFNRTGTTLTSITYS